MTFAVCRSLVVLTTAFTSTTRPVMVRAIILGHEPRQARVAGEAYVMCVASFPSGFSLDAEKPTTGN